MRRVFSKKRRKKEKEAAAVVGSIASLHFVRSIQWR